MKCKCGAEMTGIMYDVPFKDEGWYCLPCRRAAVLTQQGGETYYRWYGDYTIHWDGTVDYKAMGYFIYKGRSVRYIEPAEAAFAGIREGFFVAELGTFDSPKGAREAIDRDGAEKQNRGR